MATRLADKGTHYEVSTEAGPNRRRRIPRGTVRVPKGEPELLRAEVLRQAQAARLAIGIKQVGEVPVD